jgi:DNA-directed RNA polymerase subunit RPC12/RpoP
MKSTNTSVRYDDVAFHRHAIKKYMKSQGVATIEVSTTLEYYYYNSKIQNSDLKKQTRYTCEFIYIYDQSKFEDNQNTFIVRCPNCGATIRNLKNLTCEYCMSKVQPINLRLWKMSSYKEDYK